jgi:benzoyl-CoA reductase/2-hydroxyglutaryl-CoA dehydratase subunit BcrC/BadD/HgdB
MPAIDLVPFVDALTDPLKKLAGHQEFRGVIGWFCTYTPIELIHAAGFIPMRIAGGPLRVEHADSLCPGFVCPYLRTSLEQAMRGQYDDLVGVVTGYTCDAACGMINIWGENIPHRLNYTIPLPYNDGEAATAFYRATLEEFVERLASVGGVVTEDSLTNSLDLYHDIRALLTKLSELRSSGRLGLSAREYYAVVGAGVCLPPEEYYTLLLSLFDALPEDPPLSRKGISILVSGSLIEEPGVYDIIEKAGGRIVADDLCTGYRFIDPIDGEGPTPMDRLIDRYMHRLPCPSRSVIGDRTVPILESIHRSGARGVVFLFQKFCTPHLADYPYLSGELKKDGIPSLLVEMEETGVSEGQMLTRLQGFFEMIGE